MSFATLPACAKNDNVKPFKVDVPEQTLADMMTLVKLSKVAVPSYENTHTGEDNEWYYGIGRDFVERAKKVWEAEYDWRKTESHINSFPNFMAKVTDDDNTTHDVHFVALFSRKKDAVPLVMVHGWPGNFLEFLPILSILKSKYTPETLPYNVVIPSLAGYTFSSVPVDKSFGTADASRVVHKLMLLLGLPDYVAQGGDIGAGVARICVTAYKECSAAHVNMMFAEAPKEYDESALTELDKKHLGRGKQFMAIGSAYAMSHATVPATIGLVLSSSPIALLAWIGEKLHRWTDETPPISTILDFVSLYYLTDTIPRNLYSYREIFVPGQKRRELPSLPDGKVFGFSSFEQEISVPPKSWAEAWVGGKEKMAFYRHHGAGGHFAALEKPDVLLKDVDDFVALVQAGGLSETLKGSSL